MKKIASKLLPVVVGLLGASVAEGQSDKVDYEFYLRDGTVQALASQPLYSHPVSFLGGPEESVSLRWAIGADLGGGSDPLYAAVSLTYDFRIKDGPTFYAGPMVWYRAGASNSNEYLLGDVGLSVGVRF